MPVRILAAIAAVVLIAACGDVRVAITPPPSSAPMTTTTTEPRPTTTTTVDPRPAARVLWLQTVAFNEAAARAKAGRVPIGTAITAHYPASFAPCDGDYPPCWRVSTESGGRYDAYNPGGCDGNGCYGKWQFSGAWAGKLGLPADIRNATPAQQDEAARQLWDHGRGCSNWSAC